MLNMWRAAVFLLAIGYFETISGQDILVGTLPNFQHGIGGDLYVRDVNTLVIEDFSYDGLGPESFLYYFEPGVRRAHFQGNIIPVPNGEPADGSFVFRRRYRREQLLISLPEGVDACDIGELTIWCRPFRAFFTAITLNHDELFEDTGPGGACVIKREAPTTRPPRTAGTTTTATVTTETSTTPPPKRGVEVGRLPANSLHGISGVVFVLDSRTLLIKEFSYDGQALDPVFYFFRPGQVPDVNGGGTVIPLPGGDEDGGFVQDRNYTSEDLTLKLPEGVDACDVGTLTIWSQPLATFYTKFALPVVEIFVQGVEECKVQPGLETLIPFQCPSGQFVGSAMDCDFDNCVSLDDQLQLSWTVREAQREIDFRLCGCESADPNLNQYMGFGLSGSEMRTLMFGADPTITWIDDTTGPHAVDYFLSGYFQCRGGEGACPDEVHSGGSCTNDILSVSGSKEGGQQCVIYTRSYSTNDSRCDIPIDPTNRNQYIVWGVGGLGETAFQHFIRADATDPPIHLGREGRNQCRAPVQCSQCTETFKAAVIEALEDASFYVKIGPSGADRGYEAIAGQVGWGIAYYINDTLVPELVVQRDQTYTFVVEAGDDPDDPANFHPLYITDDIHGSRLFKSPEERENETVLAGFDENDNYTTAGRLCRCSEGQLATQIRENCGSREEYEERLDCSCREGEPALLEWTPDKFTPDIVYYQCAVHLNLGWRIRVQDPPDPCASFDCPSHAVCRVFSQTGEPYCDPSCDINNGGCKDDEICELLATPCAAPPPPRPCPLVVACRAPTTPTPEVTTPTTEESTTIMPADPCASVRCANGHLCRVYQQTGEAYCEPSCDLNNGGCSLGTHCILRSDSDCRDPPCPQLRSCCPHPLCDKELCNVKATRRALCTNPSGSGCSANEECPVTFCHTCYFSTAAKLLPGDCGDSCGDYSSTNSCSKRWGTCIRRAHHSQYGKAWPKQRERIASHFRCHSPPCPQK